MPPGILLEAGMVAQAALMKHNNKPMTSFSLFMRSCLSSNQLADRVNAREAKSKMKTVALMSSISQKIILSLRASCGSVFFFLVLNLSRFMHCFEIFSCSYGGVSRFFQYIVRIFDYFTSTFFVFMFGKKTFE